jgi:hypothetical protein
MNTSVRKAIRKRKCAYRKAKRTNSESSWAKFRRLRNDTVTLIRRSKLDYNEQMANKLKSEPLSPKSWWSTLKYFISPNTDKTIPPLKSPYTDNLIHDSFD